MGIITKTYLSKCNTIVKDSAVNLSLNPVMELNYGKGLTRSIVYFDHSKVQKLIEDGTYLNTDKLRHTLHITNTASLMKKEFNCGLIDYVGGGEKERAVSFDLIFFYIPKPWDSGKGYDYVKDLYNGSYRAVSTDASNWYNRRNYIKWDEEGIYSTETLSKEMDKATSLEGNTSAIIFGYQHFEYGNEDICLDITCVFNKFLTGEIENNGIGIAFSPALEQTQRKKTQYVGFFTQSTHTFFEPYVETIYDETIEDDRNNFYLDKDNKLYFYASVGGNYVNLDELPTCTINGAQKAVKQATKGVYYTEVNLSSKEYGENTMIYDIWGNIKYNGQTFDDVEMSFVTKSAQGYFSFGKPTTEQISQYIPTIYGINFKEEIKRGDIRKVNVDCTIKYTSNQQMSVDCMEYRIYVLEGDERQHDVIKWTKIERTSEENYFLVNTNELPPSRYYVDVRVKKNNEIYNHLNLLEFDIVSDVTETYD